jgi:hypothetical protein
MPQNRDADAKKSKVRSSLSVTATWMIATVGCVASGIAVYQYFFAPVGDPTTKLEANIGGFVVDRNADPVTVKWRLTLRNAGDHPITITRTCTLLVYGDSPESARDMMKVEMSNCQKRHEDTERIEPWKAEAIETEYTAEPSADPFQSDYVMLFSYVNFIDSYKDEPFKWTRYDCRTYYKGELTDSCLEKGDGGLMAIGPG